MPLCQESPPVLRQLLVCFLSLQTEFPFSRILFMWNYTEYTLLSVFFCTLHHILTFIRVGYKNSLLFSVEQQSIIGLYYNLFIPSPLLDGHLFFQCLTTVNEAVDYIHKQVFVQTRFFISRVKYLEAELLGHMVSVYFTRNRQAFPKRLYCFTSSTAAVHEKPPSTSSLTLGIVSPFLLCINLKGNNFLSTGTGVHVSDRKVNLTANSSQWKKKNFFF